MPGNARLPDSNPVSPTLSARHCQPDTVSPTHVRGCFRNHRNASSLGNTTMRSSMRFRRRRASKLQAKGAGQAVDSGPGGGVGRVTADVARDA